MKSQRKNFIGLTLAAGLAVFGASAHGQAVQTPYSPVETGLALSPAEELQLDTIGRGSVADCATPYSPSECGPSERPAVGGTLAGSAGGSVRLDGGSMDTLPVTPDTGAAIGIDD